jgi:hypothetical protein
MPKLAVLAPWSSDFKDNSIVTEYSLVVFIFLILAKFHTQQKKKKKKDIAGGLGLSVSDSSSVFLLNFVM